MTIISQENWKKNKAYKNGFEWLVDERLWNQNGFRARHPPTVSFQNIFITPLSSTWRSPLTWPCLECTSQDNSEDTQVNAHPLATGRWFQPQLLCDPGQITSPLWGLKQCLTRDFPGGPVVKMLGTWVGSLIRELTFHMPWSNWAPCRSERIHILQLRPRDNHFKKRNRDNFLKIS